MTYIFLAAVQEANTVNLWPVIVGGAIGIVGGVAGPICVEWRKCRSERLSLTGAIVSEIAAIVEIAERRKYVEHLRAFIIQLQASQIPPTVTPVFHFSVRRNPFAVFDANLARLGTLIDPMPRQIVKFYSQASAILEDIADMREGLVHLSPADSIRRLEELLKLFEDTLDLGGKIVAASER